MQGTEGLVLGWGWGVGAVTALLTLGILHISTTDKGFMARNSSMPESGPECMSGFLALWCHWDVFGEKAEKNKPQHPSPTIIRGHSVTDSSAEPCAGARQGTQPWWPLSKCSQYSEGHTCVLLRFNVTGAVARLM